jgi:hypothetical protein
MSHWQLAQKCISPPRAEGGCGRFWPMAAHGVYHAMSAAGKRWSNRPASYTLYSARERERGRGSRSGATATEVSDGESVVIHSLAKAPLRPM